MSTARRLAAVALLAAAGALAAQPVTEHTVRAEKLGSDKAGTWTMAFRYKAPRIVTVDVPGKGKQTAWYMWFQVYLPPRADEKGREFAADPEYFIPLFELVTRDRDVNQTFLDEPRPYLVEAVRKIEDPRGVLDLQTTVSIAKRPIPPTKPDSIPRAVSGVAIWTDLKGKAPQTNRFSVFVSGLSDGLTTKALPTGEVLINRKTLQLDFTRPTDEARSEITDIRVDTSAGPAEKWIYRPASRLKAEGGLVNPPALPGAKADPPAEPKKD